MYTEPLTATSTRETSESTDATGHLTGQSDQFSLQESRADAKEPRGARCRRCCFWFKVRRQHSLQVQEQPSFESQASELQTCRCKTEFNAMWPF